MTFLFDRLKENWRSAISVALVSVPLSIALAVASGATPAMGIITAVWAGLLASIFGGSAHNIVGPAGALSGMIAAYSLVHGPESLPLLAIASGVFIFFGYLIKIEKYLVLIPNTVMIGFSLGVAFLIGLGQINSALRLEGLEKHSHFILNVLESIKHLNEASLASALVTLAFFAILFAFVKFIPKVPPVVAVTPFGILLGFLTTKSLLPFDVLTLGEKFSGTSLSLVQIPTFAFDISLLSAGLSIACVAIIETLISARIGEMMTGVKFNRRKEMLGLSIASIGSGLAGGLPPTGVFVRTGVNIKSGATHQISQGLHSVIVAVIAVALFSFVNYLPMPVVASILLFASVRMVETKHFVELYKNARVEFVIALLVAIIMIFVDTIVGLGVGALVMLLFFIQKTTKGSFEMTTNAEGNVLLNRYYTGDTIDASKPVDKLVYSFKGSLTYIDAEAHEHRVLDRAPKAREVILRLRELAVIDLDGVHTFDRIVDTLEERGVSVHISSGSHAVVAMLKKGHAYAHLKTAGRVHENTRIALGLV